LVIKTTEVEKKEHTNATIKTTSAWWRRAHQRYA